MTKSIEELVGSEAVERLRTEFGEFVDNISVTEKLDATIGCNFFDLRFEVWTLKTSPPRNLPLERERQIGVGIAEIRQTLYRVLEIGKENKLHKDELRICVDNKLPSDKVLMHPEVYAKLKCYDHDILIRINEILGINNENNTKT